MVILHVARLATIFSRDHIDLTIFASNNIRFTHYEVHLCHYSCVGFS